jgi:hypothetical protein
VIELRNHNQGRSANKTDKREKDVFGSQFERCHPSWWGRLDRAEQFKLWHSGSKEGDTGR